MRNIWWKAASIRDLTILLTLMREYYSFEGIPFNSNKATQSVQTLFQEPHRGEIILICVKDTVIGYVALTNGYSLEFGGVYQFIDEFFIREKFRRDGAGAATLKFVEQLGQDTGITALHLEVEHKNEAAQKFYAKLGFKGQGRHLLVKHLRARAPKNYEPRRRVNE